MLTMKRLCLVLALAVAAGCDCESPIGPSDPSASAVVSLAVTGKTQLNVNEQAPYVATATFSDGSTRNVTAESVWASDAAGICAVNGPGLLTAVAGGGCTLSAVFSGVIGTLGLSIIGPGGPDGPDGPNGPTVLGLTVQGPTPISVGQSVQWQAIANLSDGSSNDVTSQSTWASANGSIATVSPSGQVTGQSPGTTSIQAVFQGTVGSGGVTVSGGGGPTPALVSLTVTGNGTIPVGGSSQLQATANFSDGSTQNVTGQAAWTSSAPAIASVAGGLVGGQSAGNATISATWNGQTGQLPVEVTGGGGSTKQLIGLEVVLEGNVLGGAGLSRVRGQQARPQNIVNLPANLNLLDLLSDPILDLTVFALYSDGSKENVTQLAALSSDNPLLRVDSPGVLNAAGVLVQTLIDPEHVVNVEYQGFTAIVTVRINAPLLGDLPIAALQLPNVAALTAGTKLPAVTAILNNGVGGTVELLIPSGTAGLEWEVVPRDYVPILGPVLGPTVNAVLNPLGNLVGDLLTVTDGTVQSLNLGPIGGILSLLGGVLQVDVRAIVDGLGSNLVPSTLPLS